MKNKPERVFLATESLVAKASGIGRVARLIAKILAEQTRDGILSASASSFSDCTRDEELGLPVMAARGSRTIFAGRVHMASLSHQRFIYDSVNMARAHMRLALARRPFMAYIHGVEIWENASPKWVRSARRAQQLVANSSYTRQRANRCHGGFDDARICWLGTETDELPPRQARLGGPPKVLIVSRIDKPTNKGHNELIAGWPAVVSAVPDARLVIAGDGPGLAQLKHLASRSAPDHIEFRGYVQEADMETLWSEATVFAMPSRKEGFGLVYIESMRQGIPVVASVHDAAPEINLHGETGYNVNLDRNNELADCLIHLLRDETSAARLGRQGRERWVAHFRYSAFRQRFLPILNEFLRQAA